MLEAFLVAFGLIFLAELGDKSQLLSLALATRYPAWLVLAAVSLAALLMQAVAVALGAAVGLALPTDLISILAGIVFLGFAVWTLRDADEHDDDDHTPRLARGSRWALLAIAGAFVVAELGDKTQLVALTLGAAREPIGTWLGASLGMIAVNALAVAVGAALGSRLPERAIRLLSAAAFAVFGVLLIASGFGVV